MKPLLVVDSPKRWPLEIPGTELVSSYAYLSDPAFAEGAGRKVFNLCRSFRYQAAGYYVSLLAEARGHRPLPSVSAIQDLRLAPVLKIVSQDLDELIQSNLRRIRSDEFDLSIYFGHNLAAGHDRLALAIFNAFPAPLLRARFERDESWKLTQVRVIGLGEAPESHRQFIVDQATRCLRRTPRRGKTPPPTKYDLAILHDPDDPMPPSQPETLRRFVDAGESVGIACDLVRRDAYGRIAEYDALFIRETTYVNHHTYRIARRAEAEGMVVVDDPGSILRCTNKVFLAETLSRHRVATPRTLILSRDNALEGLRALGFPCVLKRPDSSFSNGVSRCDDEAGAPDMLAAFFEDSDLLVAQEYVPTDFDWRIGVLGGEPLFACRYGMAPDHWQIVKRDDQGVHEGDSETLPVEEAPPDVVKLAVRASNLMGDGLYGVDLKVLRGKAVVIEVNDNPNLDVGVEDAALGDELYLRILRHFFWKLESR
ncbi:MAG: RimK family protein [Phycisphaeraceae bacterium]|nr:RimK family protein [Phycisphaeraceae bacterium]MCB9847527.1 RimK family protein [Phycisphaeraceae bacterium]